jgi:HEAT repeat protein
MTRRSLYVMSVIAVLLGARGAYAERLGGSYRGPEDLTKEKDSGSSADTGSSGSSSGGDTGKGDSGSGSGGGTGSEGGSSGGSGGGAPPEGGGGSSSPPDNGGGASGPDAGGGGDTSGGKSSGGTGGSSGGSAPSGGSSSSTGGRGKAASTTDQFYVASWFFEQNREQLIARYNATQNRRVRVPKNSSAAVFGVLPLDTRQRSDVTSEDRNKVFDILKTNVKFAREAVVRDAAAIALGKLGTPAAVELLKAQFAIETDLAVKQDILVALGMSRSKDAVPLLVDTLKNEKAGKLASFALLGLGLSQDADRPTATVAVLDYFNANLRKSGFEDQLSCAAVALGSLRAPEAVKPLIAGLGSAKGVPDVVRCFCAQALGKFGSLEGKENEDAVHAAEKALESALEKSGQEIERAAAAALGNFKEASVAKLLATKQGIGKPDPLTSGLAAVSLGRVLSEIDEDDWKGAPDELRTVAQAPEKGAVKSQYAHLALSYFGGYDKDVRKYYMTAFAEAKLDKDVLSAMAMSAGLGGFSTAQTALRDIAKDPGRNVNTRAYAAMAMGMVGQAQAKDTAKALRDLLDSVGDDPTVRRGVVLGLGFVGDANDVPKLVNIIETTKEDLALSRYVRGAAVISLGMIRDGNSIGKVQELTGRADPRTRAYALAALGCLADKDEVPAMSQLFDAANFRAKCGSIDALMHQL